MLKVVFNWPLPSVVDLPNSWCHVHGRWCGSQSCYLWSITAVNGPFQSTFIGYNFWTGHATGTDTLFASIDRSLCPLSFGWSVVKIRMRISMVTPWLHQTAKIYGYKWHHIDIFIPIEFKVNFRKHAKMAHCYLQMLIVIHSRVDHALSATPSAKINVHRFSFTYVQNVKSKPKNEKSWTFA